MSASPTQHKICPRCKVCFPITEFRFQNISKNLRYSYCRACRSLILKDHYRRNKDAYLKRNARFRLRNSEIIREYKTKPCADCGVQYPYYVMDFDHRRGEIKVINLANASRMTRPKILEEISKCDVVCSNCHRERTYQRKIKKQSSEFKTLQEHQPI
jgi:hypothetical protein